MTPKCSSSAINLPFTFVEWKFFAAVSIVNLALDSALMRVEHWLLVDLPRAWHTADLIEGCAVAILFAQIGVLAVWASLFPGSHLLRVLLATLVLCLSYYLLRWFAEAVTPSIIDYRRWAGLGGLPMLVLVFYGAQLPFWMLRFLSSLHISRVDVAPRHAPEIRRFSMLQMLGWAAFLSLPLSLVRIYLGRDAVGAGVTLACLMLVIWMFSLLYLWAALGAQRLAWGLLIGLPGGIVLILIAAQLFLWMSPRTSWRELYQPFLLALAGITVAGLGTGIAARWFGYRLRSARIDL